VSSYFTAMKGLWDELGNHQPIPTCTCGALKTIMSYHHQKLVYEFLMGLNESFSQVRGQILLIDPLPSINKVFSLVVQEERQRMVSSSSLSFNQNTTAADVYIQSEHHSAFSRITTTAAATNAEISEFLNKRDNPLFWSSGSGSPPKPDATNTKARTASNGAADDSRGRSVTKGSWVDAAVCDF
jgi:hypothetical protein